MVTASYVPLLWWLQRRDNPDYRFNDFYKSRFVNTGMHAKITNNPIFVDPSAPPSRCGGTITLVLDTSGSVPQNNGGIQLENAATEFIDLFTGTPVRMNVVGFDRAA